MDARPLGVRFEADVMWMELEDGRSLGVPLAWFRRLLHGSPSDRAEVTLSASGTHWEALDEEVSIAGLLARLPGPGKCAMTIKEIDEVIAEAVAEDDDRNLNAWAAAHPNESG